MEIKIGDKFKRCSPFDDRVWEVVEVDNVNKTYNLKEKTLGVTLELTEIFLRSQYEKISESSNSISCEHDWKNYVGFTDSFEYCKNCGEKKHV